MAFFCLLLYLIVLYLRPAEWIAVFYGWQLVDVTLMGAALFLAFRVALSRGGLVKVPHTLMMLGLFGAVLLSHAANTYVGGLVSAFGAFGKLVVTYLVILYTVTTTRKFQVTLWVLIALTALLAYQGIQQAQTGYGWAGQGLAEGGRIRWISIFSDPNDLALAFVIVVPLLLSYLFKQRLFFGAKAVSSCLIALMLYGIYLTNSRGGVLGLMAAVVFYFIKRSRWVVPGGIIGGVFATLIFLFAPSRMGAISAQESSAYGRLDAWYYGFGLIKSSPVFGVGYNMFTNDYPLTAHNSFVLAASELGLIGLCLWVGLLYTSFKGLSLIQKHVPMLAPYAFGLQAGLVGFAATAFFLSRTYIEMPYMLCALSAALYHVAHTQTDAVEFQFTRRDARNVLLLSLGSLVLVQIAMKTWL